MEELREFTKSAISFTWAMSLFGAQQAARLFAQGSARHSFEGVVDATTSELSEPFRSVYRAGDRLQKEMVDMAFSLFSARTRESDIGSARSSAHTTQSTSNAHSRTTEAARNAFTPQESRSDSLRMKTNGAHASAGWGAMRVDEHMRTAAQADPPLVDHVIDAISDDEQISDQFPFESRYAEVFGSRMHYIEEGEGDPILFVHGNGTWSYIWRNVMPRLAPYGRCIAPDLIGFGLSDKPDIEYLWIEQAEYLEEFIRKLDLKNVTLVLNDFGISLGMRYAMRHESEVRGIAFFEGVFKTFESMEEAYTPEHRPLFEKFRAGDAGGEGYKMLVEENFFIERMLPMAAGRELTQEELRRYREPFKEPRSRIPIWRLVKSVPIAGEPQDVWAEMTEAVEWFKRTDIPKLLCYATPGGLVTSEFVEWCRGNLKNLKTAYVGAGVHYLQESSPRILGRELVKWLADMNRGSQGEEFETFMRVRSGERF